jgi:hypothetical protein
MRLALLQVGALADRLSIFLQRLRIEVRKRPSILPVKAASVGTQFSWIAFLSGIWRKTSKKGAVHDRAL